MEKLIITVAPTGSFPSRKDTPYLPITLDEMAEEVFKSWKAGASVCHLHVRDPVTGAASSDSNLFREYISKIRERCDIIVNFTTGGGRAARGEFSSQDQELMRLRLECRPDMASLNMGSINYWFRDISAIGATTGVFMNPIHVIEDLAKLESELGIKPELEIWDTGMVNVAIDLMQRGILKPPLHFQFVMGAMTGVQATPKNLINLMESIPPDSTWSVCAIGRHEFPMATIAILLGGHVRVGMEDNIYLEKKVLAKSNAELVDKVVRLAKELGREVASSSETRKILGLKPLARE